MKTKTLLAALAISSLALVAVQGQVTVTTVITNGLVEPYNVVVDADNNVYVSDSGNNQIVRIDASTQTASTLAGIPEDAPGSNDGPPYLAHFNNPEGLLETTLGGVDGLVVSDNGNSLIRFVRISDGTVTTLAGQAGPGTAVDGPGASARFLYPLGLADDGKGHIYIADWGNNAIRVMDLNDPVLSVKTVSTLGTTLNRPTSLAFGGAADELWVTDGGNQQVKLISLTSTSSGNLTTYLGGYRTIGTLDSTFGPSARFNGPSGLLWVNGVGLLISDTLNNSIRLATNYPAFGSTNYAVSTFAGTPGSAGLVDGTTTAAKFNSPYGLAFDIQNNGFLVADLKNNGLRRVQIGPPLPPVPTPQIGWVLFVKDAFGDYVSSLQVGQSFVFNNDVIVAILGTDGTETHFTAGPTPSNPLNDTVPNPSKTVGSTPGLYRNGVHAIDVPPSIITAQPDVTVKAIGFAAGRQSSPVTSARFQFRVATPFIQGNNAAAFTVIEQTLGSELWYTLDGSDPTNAAPSIGPIAGSQSGINLSLPLATNFTFKIRGFRDSYQPSEIASQEFSSTNFNANKITFGFPSGEASSDFIASAGQFFYAPVTLNVLPNAQMYSLQFNVTVATNPGTVHLVDPGAVAFTSTLMQQVTPDLSDHLPPASQTWYATIPPATVIGFTTNAFGLTNIPVFGSLLFTNSNSSTNLLGVGWLERWGFAYLYNTELQDLISYSIAHDTLFLKGAGRVVVGSYGFKVPLNANAGDSYRIQIGRPSATSDGVGAPGSSIFIEATTNGSLSSGAINSFKDVTVGQRKYVAGDVYPFRWFNAGDFGKGFLENADVMQVFQSAIYLLDNPPSGSDFFDGMDSCGYFATTDPLTGLLVPYTKSPVDRSAMFDGNDQCINYVGFGDGVLDVCDVFVTFRRSLDPSLVLYQRFWTNGTLVAQIVGNPATNPPPPLGTCTNAPPLPLANRPTVSFASADIQASPGQFLQIPITAQMAGSYPLRVLGLNLSVKPLDGSPALSAPLQFTPNSSLGQPTITGTPKNGAYAATWLDNSITGLSGTAVLGTLTFQIPANATSSSAYAVHFDHASASPNGLASFSKRTATGLITLSDRSTSTYNDGIPDSWRLRYFGTVNNLLSQASADADGDGMNNWQEYVAGTDPTDAKSNLRVATDPSAAQQLQDGVIRWPSVAGKSYIIERATSLFSPAWTPISTMVGTGTDMEFHDLSGGNVRFYRVRVQ